jgi:hypothetical protein
MGRAAHLRNEYGPHSTLGLARAIMFARMEGRQLRRETGADDALARDRAAGLRDLVGLECVECGRHDDGRRGWRAYLDVDDELQTFCPVCAEREFGDS